MTVSLPQSDPDPAAREAERAAQRQTYRYTWHRPEGVATAAEVPKADGFSAGVGVRFAGVTARVKAHEVESSVGGALDRVAAAASASAGEPWLKRWAGAVKKVAEGEDDPRATPEVALSFFDERPPFVAQLADHPEQADRLFAWQRLGGSNPMALRACEAPGAVSDAHFAAAMAAAGIDGDSLGTARDEGRLFEADWTWLEGARTGALDGRDKHVHPARALFVQQPRAFLPVSVEVADAVFTPGDGTAWEVAKLAAQCADLHEQALVWHLARCHFQMDAFALATLRQLADAHPVKVLLRPHLQYTLAINGQVRDNLMKPGEDLETLLATTLGQSLWAVSDAVAAFDYPTALPPNDVEARGIGDPTRLVHCPWRDDGLDVWGAIRDFVSTYLALYYASDADVEADREVRDWALDLRAHFGGRLRSVLVPTDRDALADLVSFVIWTAGPLHTVCNYSQFEYMSYAPNLPTALYGPAPRPGASEADLHAQYLPRGQGMTQWAFFYEQTQLTENHLGAYPSGTFDDARVPPLVSSFVGALNAVETRIGERNATRPASYDWLRPSRITASIHS